MPVTSPPKRRHKPDGPLSAAEQRALLSAWAEQYPQPWAFIRSKYQRLYAFARKCGYCNDEIGQMAFLGAVRGARLFDPSRGVKFSSFIGHWCRAGVLRGCQIEYRDLARRGERRMAYLGRIVNGKGQQIDVPDHAHSEQVDVDYLREEVRRLIRKHVHKRDRQVVELRFWVPTGGEELTYDEVAAALGMTRQRVHQVVQRAIQRLRPHLAKIASEHLDLDPSC